MRPSPVRCRNGISCERLCCTPDQGPWSPDPRHVGHTGSDTRLLPVELSSSSRSRCSERRSRSRTSVGREHCRCHATFSRSVRAARTGGRRCLSRPAVPPHRSSRPVRGRAAWLDDAPALVATLAQGQSNGSALPRRALEDIVAGCRSAPECELRDMVLGSTILPEPAWNTPLPDPRCARSRRLSWRVSPGPHDRCQIRVDLPGLSPRAVRAEDQSSCWRPPRCWARKRSTAA